jgi:hypothetical protein
MIKKTYNPILYPINFTEAAKFDWETIMDRLVLSNPDILFVADRSYITQVIYQSYFGTGENAVTQAHQDMEKKLNAVLKTVPHLVVLPESDQYELDSMVTNVHQVDAIKQAYVDYIEQLASQGVNTIRVHTTKSPFTVTFDQIMDKINDIAKESGLTLIPR